MDGRMDGWMKSKLIEKMTQRQNNE